MVLPGLPETEEVEAFARDLGSFEVPSHVRVVQVVSMDKFKTASI